MLYIFSSTSTTEDVLATLQKQLDSYTAAVTSVAAKMNSPYEFLHAFRWGTAVDHALRAEALTLLISHIADRKFSDTECIQHHIDEIERNLLNAHDLPNSTSAFSNAVAIERMQVLSRFRSDLLSFKHHIEYKRTHEATLKQEASQGISRASVSALATIPKMRTYLRSWVLANLNGTIKAHQHKQLRVRNLPDGTFEIVGVA